jgi:ABC-type antimicrobial peptide transport system permease subunit
MTQLATAFGVLALLLAGVGLYGVTAFAVASRRAEIAVRVALGATPANVAALVVTRVGVLVAIGGFTGVALTLGATRFLDGLLYDVPSRDPRSLWCSRSRALPNGHCGCLDTRSPRSPARPSRFARAKVERHTDTRLAATFFVRSDDFGLTSPPAAQSGLSMMKGGECVRRLSRRP